MKLILAQITQRIIASHEADHTNSRKEAVDDLVGGEHTDPEADFPRISKVCIQKNS